MPDQATHDALKRLADQGDAKAKFLLSRELLAGRKGKPTPSERATADALLRDAARSDPSALAVLLFEQIVAADKAGERPVEELKSLARIYRDDRDPNAALGIAQVVSLGLGDYPTNEADADRMYQAAVTLGMARAHFFRYEHNRRWGQLVEASLALEEACKAGDPRALYAKGVVLMESPIDQVSWEGVSLLQQAAQKNFVPAGIKLFEVLSDSANPDHQRMGLEALQLVAPWSDAAAALLSNETG